jgi:oligopeptide transport system substrate-binding protein
MSGTGVPLRRLSMAKLRLGSSYFVAFVAVMALLLAACSGSDDDKQPADGNSSQAGLPADAAPSGEQVIKLRLTGEPKSIDPQQANFDVEISIAKQLFSQLFTYNEKLEVVPDLAKELPTPDNGGISKDGKTYTVKLKDAKFSNDRKITARDVVYSLARELDPSIASPYSSQYYSIVGAKEYNTAFGTKDAPKSPAAADLAKLKEGLGLKAIDDTTVQIALVAPSNSFLQQLAIWPASVVPQEVIDKAGNKWTEAGTLVGSGPFLLKEWAHNDHITLVANPNWHGGRAKLNEVRIKIIPEDTTAYAAYMTGDLDTSSVPPANRKEVMAAGSPLNKQLVRKSELSTFGLEFNQKEKPWDDVRVRQAFGAALDRKALIDGVYQGVGQPTTSWVPPGMPGYDKDIGKKYEFDAGKARQLLATAGYPNGQGLPRITMMITASDTNRLIGQFMQDQFKKNLNVDLNVEYVDSPTYQSRYTKSQFNFVLGGWGADWPFPDNWIDEHFSIGGSHNQYNFNEKKVDDLITKAKAETDAKKQLSLYNEIEKAVVDDYAVIVPIYNREIFLLVKPHVKDLIITGLDAGIRGDYNLWRTYIARG